MLDAVQSWARSLERTPGTALKLDEEELRDLLLGTFNGYWSGTAGGELFNGSGEDPFVILAPEELAPHLDERVFRVDQDHVLRLCWRLIRHATHLLYEIGEEGSLITMGRTTDK